MNSDQLLGAKIKRLRKAAGLSQEHVGRILKLHQAAICRIENGEQKITAVQLFVLAKGFDVTIGDFFRGGGDEQRSQDSNERDES